MTRLSKVRTNEHASGSVSVRDVLHTQVAGSCMSERSCLSRELQLTGVDRMEVAGSVVIPDERSPKGGR